jgi:hypothetical protein
MHVARTARVLLETILTQRLGRWRWWIRRNPCHRYRCRGERLQLQARMLMVQMVVSLRSPKEALRFVFALLVVLVALTVKTKLVLATLALTDNFF